MHGKRLLNAGTTLSLGLLLFAEIAGAGPLPGDAPTDSPPDMKASMDDLAKASQNPVANLISVPVETVWNFDTGYRKNTQTIVSFKPVIPTKLSEEWLLINRFIAPVIDQPKLAPTSHDRFGLGDVVYQGFLSPARPGPLMWGLGPVIGFPTATDDVLGSEQWTLGPSAVLIKTDGAWVYGGLVSNSWSVARSDSDRTRTSAMSVQPFVNWNFGGGWYLTTAPTLTANWNAEKGRDIWTVPVGAGIGRVFRIGDLPLNVALRPYYNVVRAEHGPRWSLSFQVTFLFP